MKNKLICWDSACFLTWMLGQNGSNPERLPAIRTVFKAITDGHYKLIASVLVYTEVFESNKSAEIMHTFRALMQNRELIDVIAVDTQIAEKAMRIRDQKLKTIKTPDAIHLATAIINGAAVFHTFDKNLLKLDGKPEVDGLAIKACDFPRDRSEIPHD